MAWRLVGAAHIHFQPYSMLNPLQTLTRFWQTLLCVLIAAPCCLAQIQYANQVVKDANEGTIIDDFKAADGDLSTNATIIPPLLLGFTRLRVSFPKMAQANQSAGVYLRPNDPLLNLALLSTAYVTTYLQVGNKTTKVESFPLNSNLLTLALLSGGVTQANFTPTKQFNQIELVFLAALSAGQDTGFVEAFSTAVAPLPVVLTSFQGKSTPAGVAMQWETASEHHTSHFVVERATEAAGNFRAIGEVKSAGTSAQARQYQLLDSAPGLRNYYRLRQVDLDGTETFSPVVTVQADPEKAVLTVYPNPATDLLTVRGPVGTAFTVLDQTGRRVGGAVITEARLPQLDVHSWPVGLYFVQDVATGKRAKFVKAAR
jgi:hypothetical protein